MKKRWQHNSLTRSFRKAMKEGSVEKFRVSIEKGVNLSYTDSKRRNWIMIAIKYPSEQRFRIVSILLDARCNIDHIDAMGWNCLHYACAHGALDVAKELVARGAQVIQNTLGYGPSDFLVRRVKDTDTLLKHTAQLDHEELVRQTWEYFTQISSAAGYSVSCTHSVSLNDVLRIRFTTPKKHSHHDRIRIVDAKLKAPKIWLQMRHTFDVGEGAVGMVTLDASILEKASTYRIYYEKYERPCVSLPAAGASLDSEEETKASDQKVPASAVRTPDSTIPEVSSSMTQPSNSSISEYGDGGTPPFESDAASNVSDYKIMAMCDVIVTDTAKIVEQEAEYEMKISQPGKIGLKLAVVKGNRLAVVESAGQCASVNHGDILLAIGDSNIECGGLQHAKWVLDDAPRPLKLKFRRVKAGEHRSLLQMVRNKLWSTTSIAEL